MVVELFGVPGSGKSTLAAAVAEHVAFSTRHDVAGQWQRQPILRKGLALAADHARPSRVGAVLRFAMSARIARPDSLSRLSRILAKSCRLRSVKGAILLDQGLLQELWSVLYAAHKTAVDPAVAAPLIRAIYEGIDARIVYLEVDAETASGRIADRLHGNSRLDGLEAAQIHEDLVRTSALPDSLIEAARLAGIKVQSIDGSLPTRAAADAIAASMMTATPRRISIVGSTGSGKTHLARRLATGLGLKLYELDELRRKPGFVDAVRKIVAADEWIIDGHYRDVRNTIWKRADTVIWLNYPASTIIAQLFRRFAGKRRHRNDRREPRPQATWSARFGRIPKTLRERREYGRLLRSPEYRGATLVELRSREDAEEWLNHVFAS